MGCAEELGFCPDDIGELLRVTFFSTKVTLDSKKTPWEAQWRTARRRDRSSGALVGTHYSHERLWELGGNSKEWQPNDRTPWGASLAHRGNKLNTHQRKLLSEDASCRNQHFGTEVQETTALGVHYFLTRSCLIMTSISSIFMFRY